MDKLLISGTKIEPQVLWALAEDAKDPNRKQHVSLSNNRYKKIDQARAFLEKKILNKQRSYGINTGVGFLNQLSIPENETKSLQRNIILSHCCGVGEELPRDIVMGMWLILLTSISKGHRGLKSTTVKFICDLLNNGILGCVPSRGSVGASGDLAPSAHAALALIGEGMCTFLDGAEFKKVPSALALKKVGLKPLELSAKEGLSLINGTQLTTALALKAWHEAKKLLQWMNLSAAMSIQAFSKCKEMLSEPLLKAHCHKGTHVCGKEINNWIDSSINLSPNDLVDRIQDPYCLRCAPQVHGAVYEEIQFCEKVLKDELNSATDNPLIFPDQEELHHGGNFHAIYPARVSDRLASAITTLSSISERRINMAMDRSKSGLPYFLSKHIGSHCGLMMIQTTAAALVSECKSLCFPSSVDSIPTNCDQEDHVSMGPIAGFKTLNILKKAKLVCSIELIVALQGIDLGSHKLSKPLKAVYDDIREICPVLDKDRILSEDIKNVSKLTAMPIDSFIYKN